MATISETIAALGQMYVKHGDQEVIIKMGSGGFAGQPNPSTPAIEKVFTLEVQVDISALPMADGITSPADIYRATVEGVRQALQEHPISNTVKVTDVKKQEVSGTWHTIPATQIAAQQMVFEWVLPGGQRTTRRNEAIEAAKRVADYIMQYRVKR